MSERASTMKVHIIYNPNRGRTEIEVHRAGCRDIAKALRGCTSHYELEATSRRQVSDDFWSDFIAEESMTSDDGMGYTDFLPCLNDLSEEDVRNAEADRLAAAHNRTADRIAELEEKLVWLRAKQQRQYAAAMAALTDGQMMRHDKADTGAAHIEVAY